MTSVLTRTQTLDLRRGIVLLVMIGLGGLGLRLWRLGEQSFWYDEAQTYFVATAALDEIAQRAYRPPLYHYLLHFWSWIVPHTEFWLRLPSALLGAAVPPAAYLAARGLYDLRVALLAAALAALSPTLIWYAQELRMYSLMTLEFLLLVYLFTRIVGNQPVGKGAWVALFGVTVASLYTHYFAPPFLAWLGLITFVGLASLQRWQQLKRWVMVQAAAGLAFVPWLLVIWGGRGGLEDYVEAEAVPTVTETPQLAAFLVQSWNFYTWGTGDLLARSSLYLLLAIVSAVALGIGALLLLIGTLRHVGTAVQSDHPEMGASDRSDLYLLALVMGPFLTAMIMYYLRPGVVHPRHMLMLAGPLLILVARTSILGLSRATYLLNPSSQDLTGLAPRSRPSRWLQAVDMTRRGIGGATLATFSLIFLTGLALLYHDQAYQRADVRGLARHVETLTATGDVVLLPYTDYAFDYYFRGPAQVYHIETRVGDEPLSQWLLPRIQGAQRAVLLRWVHVFADPRGYLRWLLQTNGRLVSQSWHSERHISVYDLKSPIHIPRLEPADVQFRSLALNGVHAVQETPADQPVAVALLWESTGPIATEYRASVRAVDPGGNVVASDDRVILSEQAYAPTSGWPVSLAAHNYYFLEFPLGAPPIGYELAVSVYDENGPVDVLDAAGAPAGTVQTLQEFHLVAPAAFPQTFELPPGAIELGTETMPGLMLEGYSVDREAVHPGQRVEVGLFWRATDAPLAAVEPSVRILTANGTVIGSQSGHPAYGQHPFARWRLGEIVYDRRSVLVSPEAEAGPARVELLLADHQPLALHEVTVQATDRLFVLPEVQHPLDVTIGNVARLRGFDLETTEVRSGEPLHLTLYWEAIGAEAVEVSYAVFAQLLSPEYQMIAQQDSLPAGGEWPTTSWIAGQIIVDDHRLQFKDLDYRGEAFLQVGLYDPNTFERLPRSDGSDSIVLPVEVNVVP